MQHYWLCRSQRNTRTLLFTNGKSSPKKRIIVPWSKKIRSFYSTTPVSWNLKIWRQHSTRYAVKPLSERFNGGSKVYIRCYHESPQTFLHEFFCQVHRVVLNDWTVNTFSFDFRRNRAEERGISEGVDLLLAKNELTTNRILRLFFQDEIHDPWR